jgi:hypothetical protein
MIIIDIFRKKFITIHDDHHLICAILLLILILVALLFSISVLACFITLFWFAMFLFSPVCSVLVVHSRHDRIVWSFADRASYAISSLAPNFNVCANCAVA